MIVNWPHPWNSDSPFASPRSGKVCSRCWRVNSARACRATGTRLSQVRSNVCREATRAFIRLGTSTVKVMSSIVTLQFIVCGNECNGSWLVDEDSNISSPMRDASLPPDLLSLECFPFSVFPECSRTIVKRMFVDSSKRNEGHESRGNLCHREVSPW